MLKLQTYFFIDEEKFCPLNNEQADEKLERICWTKIGF